MRRRRTKSYNKEQFLQANCQFVVSDRGEYGVHTSDPDLLVDWDSIELVRLFCHEIPSCPICLYPPRAAKITRCGHVYCWSCVLHYLSLGDKKWRKCPICYESIYKKDLKSVMALSTPQYSPGDVISMRLMVREKNSTLVRPRSQATPSPSSHSLSPLSGEDEMFSKLLTCSQEQTLQLIVRPEREGLTTQLTSLASDELSEHCFIEQALEELKVRETDLTSHGIQEDMDKMVSGVPDQPPLPPRQWMALSDGYVERDTPPAFSGLEDGGEEEGEGGEGGSASSSMSEDTLVTEQADDSLGAGMEHVPESPDSDRVRDTSLIYFYQSGDGQHLYLHTVNARCLVKEYGGMEFAPEVIKAQIVEMEQLTMTEEARSRYRYLSHLPVTCQFALCELDLRPPVVSPETLAFYRGDLDKRRSKRSRKRRDEKRKEKSAVATQPSPLTSEGFPLPTSSCQPLSPERIHDLLPQLTSSPPHSSHLSLVAPEVLPGRSSPSAESGVQDNGQVVLNDSSADHPSFADALRGNPHLFGQSRPLHLVL
ncbi:RING finger protein 10 [Geodia barretti]|nr:RING finger protein 10 [Geodia barretti]